ncbi:MAG: hypothetical protein ABIA37_02800 [Candidatus Woesearchaeota archaeon]
MRKKEGVILLIILLSTLAVAQLQEGCYTFKDSLLYCYDLNENEALEDFLLYSQPNFNQYFYPQQNCSDFLECKEIFCKSTCDYQYSGNCLGGEVEAGKELEWCSPGCCRSDYLGTSLCEYKTSKWLCEVDAKNRGATLFNFDPNLDQFSCQNYCGSAILGSITQGLNLEVVGQPVISLPPPVQTVITPPEPITPEEKPEVIVGEEKTSIWPWFLALIIFISVIFYVLHWKNKQKKTPSPPPSKPEPKPATKRTYFINRKKIKEREEHIKQMEEEHHQKKRAQDRKELFNLFGLGDTKPKNITHTDLLHKVAHHHELRKGGLHQELEGKERNFFQELERVAKRLRGEKIEEYTESEAKKIINELKKIAGR